ncbi:hypothetical protein [Labrys neptuniae]|uniref:Prevent-host-death protein n=1 Tax=Labrys neptuniae TaxID=376174 RepID=A0ABV3PIJ9_9HYPH
MTKIHAMGDLSTLLRPPESGKAVNAHVIPYVAERKPDFTAMMRAIQENQLQQPERQINDDKVAKEGIGD